MSKRSGSGNCAGSRLAAPMHSVSEVFAGIVTPPISTSVGGDAVAELVRALVAQDFLDRGARPARAGRSGAASRRDWPSSATSPLPIRLVVVSWPALSRKMQLCSSSLAVSVSPRAVALDQPGQHVALRDRRARRGGARSGFRDRRGSRRPRRCRAKTPPAPITGSSAPRIASDQSRSGPRSSCGTPSRLPITSIGIAAAKSSIRSTSPLAAIASSSRSTSAIRSRLHPGDRARRQRAGDQPPHAGVRRRIVEHQAGGVMLEQQRVAVFRRELAFLVGGEQRGVLVDRDQIVVAGEEIAAVAQPLDRLRASRSA